MKKNLLLAAIGLAFLLTGCFGFFKKDAGVKRAAENVKVLPVPAPQTKPRDENLGPPTFQDGEIYLKALQTKDAGLCAKIQNEALKKRCELKVSK